MATTHKNSAKHQRQIVSFLQEDNAAAFANPVQPSGYRYPGGKNRAGVYQTIINQIPACKVMVEGCSGSGAIIKRVGANPAIRCLGIEINPDQAFRLQCDFAHYPNIYVQRGDILEYLQDHFYSQQLFANPDLFLYLDPPYPYECRRSQKPIYGEHEWTDEQHYLLLTLLKKIPCKAMLSSYHNSMYDKHLQDWRSLEFITYDRRNNKRTEVLYMNYAEPTLLATYEFVGVDYRERHRIKKKIQRRVAGIKNLPQNERAALLKAIQDEYGIELDNEKF